MSFFFVLFQLLNVKENSTSIETYLQCCISMLNIDNFVKCLEGNATLFTKFATYTSWVFSTSENDSENTKPDHLDIIFKLMEKIVTISKKIKWNLDLRYVCTNISSHNIETCVTLYEQMNLCKEFKYE